MSNSPVPRLGRKPPPRKKFRDHTYRQALPQLLEETGQRCAYSQRHVEVAGLKSMEVDHFNPKKKGGARHAYSNLIPAERTCNLSKWDWWPGKAELAKGIRFLNPYEESDYGVHIFEDPDTHEVFGVSPAGIYHVRKLDLNAPHFVSERRRRSELRKDCGRASKIKVLPGIAKDTIGAAIDTYKETIELLIPPLPTRKRPTK